MVGVTDVELAGRQALEDVDKVHVSKRGRGDWRSFEPYPQLIAPIAPIVAVFSGPTLPYVATAERQVRLCA
jgi:hypothetical protein